MNIYESILYLVLDQFLINVPNLTCILTNVYNLLLIYAITY